ncbi:MAG: 30S ribosomal protein S5 [Candidatus Magasanikbacteria bacterium]|uniref:Small ribosomal subunit protein uS5 n=1 Tax=Candidatus Magasanikbacteria bacterium CG10_big_fil_rev_8_21_14_0_10_38_6 TaxID=1974647 RepID=A0A2M6P0N7_9BACT|nr:30S ribosomal protein S5 [Candidatus Magasanikbacteria bacterium]NCS71905.1 30S ribosomal protein S5 [Candidatus Magasanikbacteria bacterium]PIR77267.1 MAG: 30S ribosomal protein S5 [Candidatus Magasanikbacteria bacterium CG10_big_fil_rev_8_21_14_0_10_38_6]
MSENNIKKRGGRRPAREEREKPEFEQQIVDLARVTRVTKGGKQMNFRCCILLGDKNGRVGYGVQKGSDVQLAVEKAVRQAKKNMINVPIIKETIPHKVLAKYKAGKVLLKPAPKGSGIIAGSVIRTILEMAGVPNASAKMLGKTNNKITNVKATFKALESFNSGAVIKAKAAQQSKPKATPKTEKYVVVKTAENPKKKTTTKKKVTPKTESKKTNNVESKK